MNARLDRALQVSLWRISGGLLLALVLGLALGGLAWWLFAATLAALVYLLWRLRQFGHWLQGRSRLAPVDDAGLWGALYRIQLRRQRSDTERRRRLVQVLRAFRNTAAALPDATVVLDADGVILWFNDASTRLLGLSYPHDLSGHFSNLVRSPRVTRWLQGGDWSEPLMDVPAPGDDALRLGLRIIPYGQGQRLLVARDMSKLMQLEQMRRDFVANVSHELRTPLTVVHGYLDLIEPDQSPELEPMLMELRTQSRRMTQIVEDLLTISRLEAQDSLPEERVSMPGMMQTLRREAEALSLGRHTIVMEIRSELDLSGSPKELHSAFSNLVSNAVRYTPAGGRIQLRWELRGEQPVFSVTDTGQGIAPNHLPRITERFYRVSSSRSRDTGGTGLGLSIVKHVLQLHQAKLCIESEVGVGSTFACVFDNERALQPATSEELG
ncbi:two-component system phosphate regulon sensor histidine kinase PhoR [Tahibacter aquaticus]|uniref:Phosphate regulon sensor protein PhoR n=1 Tax=Tahibacter aquaticus TaxID=520092 RepID=A0A4R6YWV3_9GAMM|nr:phosphate regulon sensor histidine kinase PhoR [Tahibacter aquaticus]TDR43275.1 two-component system phosphate regulon sensor histidine kinase PhoR [Tahibacter aquaticus]